MQRVCQLTPGVDTVCVKVGRSGLSHYINPVRSGFNFLFLAKRSRLEPHDAQTPCVCVACAECGYSKVEVVAAWPLRSGDLLLL